MIHKFTLLFCLHFPFAVLSQSQELQKLTLNDSVSILLDLSDEKELQHDLNASLKYAMDAVKYAESEKDDYSLSVSFYVLGNCFDRLKDADSALESYQKALELGKKINAYKVVINSYNGLGNIYCEFKDDLKTGKLYYEQSALYAQKTGKPKDLFISNLNLAWTYLDLDEIDKAYQKLIAARESLEISEKQSYNPHFAANLELQFARYHKFKKNTEKALLYIENSKKIALDNDMYEDLIEIYKVRFEIYNSIKDFPKAIESLKEKQSYQNKLYDSDKLIEAERLKMAFEFENYERKLATARDEKIYLEKIAQSNKRIIQITTIAIGLLLLIILLMYISYRNVKKTNELRYTNKKLEEAKIKAEQLTKLKSDFISNVSHELRTPLYGITGITSILLRDKESFSKHKEVLGALKFSSDHLLNLVNNVLKLGKIESQEIGEETKTAINLPELITSITITVDAFVRERGNHIDINIAPDIAKVFYKIDGLKLSEILYNLINNAVKFTNCGVITVEAHKTSSSIGRQNIPFDEILFVVKDTGLGIPKEKQKIIFEAFKQVNEQENIYDGVGLGLTIIKDILQNMGSTIHLESELGEGSTFSFTLNLERSDIPQSTAQGIKDPLESKRLLLAEDNKVCQIVSSKLIKQLGHEYTMVENGEEAINEYDKGGFDIVLMDLNMPVIDGYEASVRIIEKYPTAQIVALTATDISQVRDKCLKAGMISVLNKPLTREELEKTIQGLSVEW